jgi:hypothetical protein
MINRTDVRSEDIPLIHEDFFDEGKQQANDTHVAITKK